MASTRNKNTLGNYRLEDAGNQAQAGFWVQYGTPTQTFHPGDGLLAAKTARNELSANACDIESSLFGIGSTNLVEARANIVPQLNTMKSLSIYEKAKVVVEQPMKVATMNRPLFLN